MIHINCHFLLAAQLHISSSHADQPSQSHCFPGTSFLHLWGETWVLLHQILLPLLLADPTTTWWVWFTRSCVLLSTWCRELAVLAAPVFLFLPGTDALWRMNREMSAGSPGHSTLYSSEWKRWLGWEESDWNLPDDKWQNKKKKIIKTDFIQLYFILEAMSTLYSAQQLRKSWNSFA